MLPFQKLRDQMSGKIEKLGASEASNFAKFLREGDPVGPAPCWGAIAERFDVSFTEDQDRVDLLDIVLENPDRRVALVYLHTNRNRPAVVRQIFRRLDRFPKIAQLAAIALFPDQDIPEQKIHSLHPEALELLGATDDTRQREQQQAQTRIKKILAFQYFVPDTQDPSQEPSM